MEIDGSDAFRRKTDLFIYDPCDGVGVLDEWISIAPFMLFKSFCCNGIRRADHFLSALVKTGIKFIKAVHKCSSV